MNLKRIKEFYEPDSIYMSSRYIPPVGVSNVLMYESDTVDIFQGSGTINDWVQLNLDKPLTSQTLKSIWEYLYLGTCRFKTSDRIKFQIDPEWSKLTLGTSDIYSPQNPEDNEIDPSNLTLLEDKATELGYSTFSGTRVSDNLTGIIYPDDSGTGKSLSSVTWESFVANQPEDNLPDIYKVVNEQHLFWMALKEQVLFTNPAKSLPVIDTLGNTIPLYAYGERERPYSLAKVIVRYTLVSSPTQTRSKSFDIFKEDTSRMSKTDLIDGIQIIWIDKKDNSFLKILFSESIVHECYISHAKLME